MTKDWKILLIAILPLVAASLTAAATPATPDELAASMKRMEQRLNLQDTKISAQNKQIGLLKLKLNGQKAKKLTPKQQRELLDLYQELKADTERYPLDFRTYWKDGIRMDSKDGNFKLKLGGRLMADWGWIDGSGIEADLGTDLKDGAEFRRARLYAAGTIYKYLDFKLQFDFATGHAVMKDAYLKFKKLPIVGNVTVGHQKEPFGLEQLTSSKYITFMERSLADVFAPGRNMGIKANSTLFDERMTWAVGLFRANSDDFGQDDVDGESALTGRVTFLPWYEDNGRKLVHLGAAYSFRNVKDPIRYRQRPEAHWIPQRFSDTGSFAADHVNLFGVEAALVSGPFSLQSEYMAAVVESGDTRNPTFEGLYVQGSYFLTGEHRKYSRSGGAFSRVRPKRNFREDGGLGAWEVVARYSYLDLSDKALPDTARTMQNATVGLNWYLNPNVRIMWNYIRSCVDGTDVSSAADIFMTRVQVDF